MNENPYSTAVLAWYEANARDLPWRRPEATPWEILISEIMLQQTPVVRVLPAWEAWVERWPRPADLAAEPAGEAVRMWNRLGYPRRALNLHACARAIVERHDGRVPDSHSDLLALPGVGPYTAAAVASFAFGQRHAILDTNVRRVLARAETGIEYPPKTQTKAEVRLAESLLPDAPAVAARWGVAVMELGALVCTARSPKCADCPILDRCSWVLAGRPPHDGPPRRGQTYAGTDRQVRGRLLAVLREAPGPVAKEALDAVWDKSVQRERALDALVADGLVDPLEDGTYALPG
ncbi:A/G-specific adenine glycosylase [Marinactinospora thermotolerans]|uniref:Adenine DNA glycosylase n=1 Tax=Marinactinospora thermotolerans DSM 45154 TaxID=1122192 RepID=A0A1T4STH6_9ACTN|nr:A/G-specific adenine glycosylase [Marinactinospora thermotolerans]SKA31191.1 A/G-specific DNA-adenine glycosylase [Marinactinospora thermotolerans DSM 45154]